MTQNDALEVLKMGHNVFLTGSAGSGKTYLLNQYISYLREMGAEVAITASTGIAATHLGGQTIHSWSGIGIRDVLSEADLDFLEERKYLWDRFQKTRVLVIDEISMLHHFRLDMVERVLRSFRRNDLPFGGIQVILCGDFFQLPPVSKAGSPKAHFVHSSQAWQRAGFKVCYLSENFRQGDRNFLLLLNAIRENAVRHETLEPLRKRYKKEAETDVLPVKLYTHNVDVDLLNEEELEKLEAEEEIYDMTSKGRGKLLEMLKRSCLAPEKLRLKIGARVMFVKNNFEKGYVNGTLGEVEYFDISGPVVKIANGRKITAEQETWRIEEEGVSKAEITQVPLRLAWAITVHKSQGMSLDAVETDLSKSFERGMGYVALSRVRDLKGLKLLGLNKMALAVSEEALAKDKEFKKHSEEIAEELGAIPTAEIKKIQEEYIKKIAPEGAKKKKEIKVKKVSTLEETKRLILEKLSVEEVAKKRGVTIGTIVSHLEKLKSSGAVDADVLFHIKPEVGRLSKINAAFLKEFAETGEMRLSPVRSALGDTFDFEELRIARLFL
ncbi:MAG: AAA family ATPase [bacterium]|nr:AAA family ATPase [bacterium]